MNTILNRPVLGTPALAISGRSSLWRAAAALVAALVLAPATLAQYCAAGSTRCNGGIQQITRVTLNTIDNQTTVITGSGCSNAPQCYSDFTGISTDAFQGQSAVITVTYANGGTTDQGTVWVDWNQDFTFGDAASGERFDMARTTGQFTGLIVVPAGATLGPTRIRIRVTAGGDFSACGEPSGTCITTDLGQVHDYTINVRSSSTGACCDPSGTCSFTTSAECAGAYQGNLVACAPSNPCGGACCDPSGSCSVSAAAACVGTNVFFNHGTCEAGACNGACCDATTGACSLPPNAGNTCPCGSTWQGNNTSCTSSPCAAGACCTYSGAACSISARLGCNASTSVYFGNGTVCSPNPCTVSACCNLVTGACSLVPIKSACSVQSGSQSLSYIGPGSTCTPSPCGGACCNTTSGACTVAASSTGCAAGTTFAGGGAVCSPNPCPVGACCNTTSGACTTVAAAGCTTAPANSFRGLGSTCTPTNQCGGTCCNSTTRACTVVLNTAACTVGTFTSAAVCSPDPCSLGVCCTIASGACATKAAAGCTSGTQTFILNGACSPSPCGSTGFCCNVTTGACTITTAAGCSGNTWTGGIPTCTPAPCPQGACCVVATGACSLTASGGCAGAANNFLGAGTVCTTNNPCGGACCNNTTGACTTTADSTGCGSGTFLSGSLCSPYPCGSNVCCNNNTGACVVTATTGCAAGTSLVAGTLCTLSPCGQGACCNNTTGACSLSTAIAAGCSPTTSTFQGVGSSCTPNSCGTGACCLSDGSCTTGTTFASCAGSYMGPATTCPAAGHFCYAETEPNDTISNPNILPPLASGDSIVGFSTGQGTAGQGAATVDRFGIQPVAAAPGVYKHTLTLTSTSLTQRFGLRGRSQFDNMLGSANSDSSVVFDAVSGTGVELHKVSWYSFGGSIPIDVQVSGASADPYTLTLSTVAVTTSTPTSQATPMVDIGTISGGLITVSTVGETATDTDLWVYDSSFSPVPGFGNDDAPDPSAHLLVQSQVSKDLVTPGVYYLAVADNNLVTDQFSPVGDRNPNRNYFAQAGVVAQMGVSNSAFGVDLSLKIIDGAGVVHRVSGLGAGAPAQKVNSYDVIWVKFTITPTLTGACCRPDGVCQISTQTGCTDLLLGTYLGDGVSCTTCIRPVGGACCQYDGSCTLTTSYDCLNYTGSWAGANTTCSGRNCERTINGSTDTQFGGAISPTGGVFLNVIASGGHDIQVTRLDYYSGQAWNNAFPLPTADVYVHPDGTYVGAESGDCAAQTPPPNGWVFNSEAVFNPYPVGGSFGPLGVMLSTPVTVPAGQTVGFYLAVRGASVRAAATTGPAAATFSNSDLTLYSDETRFASPTSANWNGALGAAQRSFTGRVFYRVIGAGVCCRGSTCSTLVSQANCTPSGGAGASFAASASVCNTAGNHTAPCCHADYDQNGAISVQDIFDFLNSWFAGSPFANFGTDGTDPVLSVQNIFDFLNSWFAGGC